MKRLLLTLLLVMGLLSLLGCTVPLLQQTTAPETLETAAKLEPAEAETTLTEAMEPTETEPSVPEVTETQTEPSVPEVTEAQTEPSVPEVTETQTEPSVPEVTEAQTEPSVPEVTEAQTEPSSPQLAEGWLERNGKRYYRNANGELHTGWLELDGERYYFLEDHTMATGCVEIPELGKRYFTSTGKEVVLVNPWNYVPEEYTVELGTYGGYSMAEHIIEPLKQMLADCKAAGHTAIVCSAYRSHEYQINLHNRRIQRFLDQGYSEEDAKREAARRVAVPGTSEHELGLALDIVDINYQNLTEKQETMPAQQWLMENSWKYGFILRYPNEKSEITGIIYEPWHYRYVGTELAKEIHDSGLCLEEYLQQLTT